MAQNLSSTDGRDRFRKLLDRIDEQEGSTRADANAAPPLAPAYEARTTAVTVPVRPNNHSQRRARGRGGARWERFKSFAIIFSFVVNAILVLTVLVLALFVFRIKNSAAQPLVGGLYDNFVALDQANIRMTIPVVTTISVNDKVTAQFDLPLQQSTVVTLTQPTVITGAAVTIDGGVLQLTNAPTTIVLPAGAQLPIALDLSVPVEQDIPVNLQIPVNIPVAVDIPLQETELHEPFRNLQMLFAPYNDLLESAPDSWVELITFGYFQ